MNSSASARAAFLSVIVRGQVAGPVADEVIEAAEMELGLTFPDQYREFLRLYGAALVEGAELYGLIEPSRNDPPLWIDVRQITKSLRQRRQAGAEDPGYLPISDDGAGIYFFLNTGASPQTEIWAIGPGVDQAVSHDLHQFVLSQANG